MLLSIFEHTTPYIGPLIVIVGWFVIISNSYSLIKRNERFSISQKYLNELIEIERQGHKYWCGELSISPQIWLGRCSQYISHLRHANEQFTKINLQPFSNENLVHLRKSLTLDAEKLNQLNDIDKVIKARSLTKTCIGLNKHVSDQLLNDH